MPRAGKRCGGRLNVFISFSWAVCFLEDAVLLPVEPTLQQRFHLPVVVTNVYNRVVAS